MSIRNKKDIKVYNEMPSQVNLVGQYRTYVFPAAVDGVPSMNLVDFADIEYAHSRGIVFSAGLLVFDESEREEIYKELRMHNWKETVWFEKDIINAIENPTAEIMQKVISINNLITIERFRGKIVYAVNHNSDISNKVVSIINARHKEISSGQVKSKIVVKSTDTLIKEDPNKKIHELEAQIEEMKKMINQMNNDVSVDHATTAEPKEPEKAKKPASKKGSSAKQE